MPTHKELNELTVTYLEAMEEEDAFLQEFSQVFAKREQLKARRLEIKERLDNGLQAYREEYPTAKEIMLPSYNVVFNTSTEFQVSDTFVFVKRLLEHCTLTNDPLSDYITVKVSKVKPLVTQHKHVADSPLRIQTRDEEKEQGDGYVFAPVSRISYRKSKDS